MKFLFLNFFSFSILGPCHWLGHSKLPQDVGQLLIVITKTLVTSLHLSLLFQKDTTLYSRMKFTKTFSKSYESHHELFVLVRLLVKLYSNRIFHGLVFCRLHVD